MKDATATPAKLEVEVSALLRKKQELLKLKDGLQLKYNNVIGQIEIIDEILSGKIGDEKHNGSVT
jgi:hypothetical protein